MGRQPLLRARLSSAGVKSPSGPMHIKTLAGRARDDPRVVKAWHVATGGEAVAFRGHTMPVIAVRYSANGRYLLFDQGKTLQILNIEDGQPGVGPSDVACQYHFSEFLQWRPSRSIRSSASFGPHVPAA